MTSLDPARTDDRVQTFCLLTLTMIASGFALYVLKPVVVPFVLALFFCYCLAPIIEIQIRRLRLPQGVALLVTGVFGLAVLVAAGFGLAAAIGGMTRNFSSYEGPLKQLFERIIAAVPLEKLGIKVDPETGKFFHLPENAGAKFISSVLSETLDLISSGVFVVIFMIFILLGRKHAGDRPPGLMRDIETSVRRYINQTVFFSLLTGVLVAAVLALLGVQFAAVFGFLAFLLNFIPNVGGIIATLLPLPLILLSPDMSLATKVLAIVIPSAIQFTMGNIIQPRFQGGAFNLHPVVVLMALIFFGMIWGMVGAFLATPITAVIKIVFERIPATQPFADAMAGRLETRQTGD